MSQSPVDFTDINYLDQLVQSFTRLLAAEMANFETAAGHPNGHLCQPCRAMTFDKLLSGMEVHNNLGELFVCSYCDLCRLLMNTLQRPSEHWWGDEKYTFNDIVRVRLIRGATDLNTFPERLEVGITRPKEEWDRYLETTPDSPYKLDPDVRFWKHVVVCVDKKYPLASHLKIRPIQAHAFSQDNVELLRGWIEDCKVNHEKCRHEHANDGPMPLPDRVIDVGPPYGSQQPSLLLSGGKRGHWAALSYRWGSAAFIKLTNDKLESMQKSLPLSLLPVAFRDAVHVTRSLGLRYLWIDALCIIQDSVEDWRKQSTKMPDIYAGADVTLAAAGNENPDQPLLKDRTQPTNPAIPLHLGEDGTLNFTWRDPHHPFATAVKRDYENENYLRDRGWCLQEAVLSRRLLAFEQNEIVFVCGQHILLESYYEQDPAWQLKQRGPFGAWLRIFEDGDGSWKNDFFSIVQTSAEQGIHPNKNRENVQGERDALAQAGRVILYTSETPELTNQEKLWERWCLVLEDYTARNLTFERDKLPAISGVARYILENGPPGDEYHAGIFKNMLPHALLWKIPRQAGQNGQGERWTNSRPAAPRAPSWSWASMQDALDFQRCWQYLESKPVCEIVSIKTSDAASDTGVDGRLVIRGTCFSARMNSWNDHLEPPEEGAARMIYGVRHADDQVPEHAEVLCIELIPCQGLMLKKWDGGGGLEELYQRVGIYSTSNRIVSQEIDDIREITIV